MHTYMPTLVTIYITRVNLSINKRRTLQRMRQHAAIIIDRVMFLLFHISEQSRSHAQPQSEQQ